ncbi:MAG: thiosulfate oxidation carrier complex protein SoxZ [Methylophilaceae bacterium]
MKRRAFLELSFAAALLIPMRAVAAIWNKAAFDATNIEAAENGLSIANEIPSNEIEITAPSHAENGAIVQVAVNSRIPNTEAIAILVDKNPTALIGNYMFSNGALPNMVTRIKMAETSDVKVIVKVGNQYFSAIKNIQVLENGCSGTSSASEKFKFSMKIRAKRVKGGEAVQVKAIITHPMHTGSGKDDFGELVPAHFIQVITIKHNGKPTVDMQLGTGISKNPYLTFHLGDAKLGDAVVVEWHDNLGNSGSAKTKVVA